MPYCRSHLAFHRLHSMPSPMSDASSMSSVQSRIANGLSTCQTRTPAWLKQLASIIINCGDRGSMTTTNCRRSVTGASRPPRMRGYGKNSHLLCSLRCKARWSHSGFFQIQATRSKLTSGILMFNGALVNPVLLHPFYVIAILWKVHTIHRTATEVRVNLQMTLAI